MELSLILDVITAVAVVLGIFFGLLQLRHYHLSRRRESDLYLLNSFQTGEFLQGVWIIQELPDGLTKNEIEERVGKEIWLVYAVIRIWERIGILVFNHEISIDMVDEAYCDPILISWMRLEKFVTDLREEHQRERLFEWFQWLAERMKDRETSEARRPAHIAHRNWG